MHLNMHKMQKYLFSNTVKAIVHIQIKAETKNMQGEIVVETKAGGIKPSQCWRSVYET